MLDNGILSTLRFGVKKQPNITEYKWLLFKKAYKEIFIAADYIQLVKTLRKGFKQLITLTT